jgi:hypothetical protein
MLLLRRSKIVSLGCGKEPAGKNAVESFDVILSVSNYIMRLSSSTCVDLNFFEKLRVLVRTFGADP